MKTSKQFNRLSTILLCILFLLIAPMQIPKLWGWQMFAILSGSMEPAIPTGSVIYVEKTDMADIQVNDIITFSQGSDRANTATHRVVEINEEGCITKGDANADKDATIVDAKRMIGKVVFTIPVLGYFLMLAGIPIGIALFILLLSLTAFCTWKASRLKKANG